MFTIYQSNMKSPKFAKKTSPAKIYKTSIIILTFKGLGPGFAYLRPLVSPGCEVPHLNLSPLEFWGEDLLNFASGRELEYDVSRRKFTFFYAVLVCNTYKGTHTKNDNS